MILSDEEKRNLDNWHKRDKLKRQMEELWTWFAVSFFVSIFGLGAAVWSSWMMGRLYSLILFDWMWGMLIACLAAGILFKGVLK